jgi:hypothetical protein
MKTDGEQDVQLLTLVLHCGEWSALRSGIFMPSERVPTTHWIRGWAVPEREWTQYSTERTIGISLYFSKSVLYFTLGASVPESEYF